MVKRLLRPFILGMMFGAISALVFDPPTSYIVSALGGGIIGFVFF